jgi:hypothetical protein
MHLNKISRDKSCAQPSSREACLRARLSRSCGHVINRSTHTHTLCVSIFMLGVRLPTKHSPILLATFGIWGALGYLVPAACQLNCFCVGVGLLALFVLMQPTQTFRQNRHGCTTPARPGTTTIRPGTSDQQRLRQLRWATNKQQRLPRAQRTRLQPGTTRQQRLWWAQRTRTGRAIWPTKDQRGRLNGCLNTWGSLRVVAVVRQSSTR